MNTLDTGSGGSTEENVGERKSRHSMFLPPLPLTSTITKQPSARSLRSSSSQKSIRSNISPRLSTHSPSIPSANGSFVPPTTTTAGPLSTADTRAVFLNVDVLANLADEFASLLENVCGMKAQGEGWDMVGQAFITMVRSHVILLSSSWNAF